MVDTIRRAAELLQLPPLSPDGVPRWTGHTLRVTGAQGLALAGLDTWAIQLLGRWGSEAVRSYIRQAPLAASTNWARAASAGTPAGRRVDGRHEGCSRRVATASGVGKSTDGGKHTAVSSLRDSLATCEARQVKLTTTVLGLAELLELESQARSRGRQARIAGELLNPTAQYVRDVNLAVRTESW